MNNFRVGQKLTLVNKKGENLFCELVFNEGKYNLYMLDFDMFLTELGVDSVENLVSLVLSNGYYADIKEFENEEPFKKFTTFKKGNHMRIYIGLEDHYSIPGEKQVIYKIKNGELRAEHIENFMNWVSNATII